MPYDNIADAYEVSVAGAWQHVLLDTTDATFEPDEHLDLSGDAEPAGEGSVWCRVDVRELEDAVVHLDLRKISGNFDTADAAFGWQARLEIYRVTDPDAWDPSDPDWSLLDMTGFFNDRVYFRLDDLTSEFEAGYIYYIRLLSDTFFPSVPLLGSALLGIAVNWNEHVSDPTAEVNTGGGTASSGGGIVTETQVLDAEDVDSAVGYPSPIDADWTFRISGAELPPSGLYRAEVEIRKAAGSAGSIASVVCVVRRNGFPIAVSYPGGIFNSDLTSSFEWRPLSDTYSSGGYNLDSAGPSRLPVLSSDTYEFAFYSWWDGTPAVGIEIQAVRWRAYELGGSAAPPIKMLDVEDLPVGAADFASIPDLIALSGGDGIEAWIFQAAPDADGNVYVQWTEFISGGVNGNTRAPVAKWDGASWTLVTVDPFNLGDDGSFVLSNAATDGSVSLWSMTCDGEDLYFAYSIYGTGQSSSVHVTKVDVSGPSVSELGTGLQPLAPGTFPSGPGSYEQGMPNIKCSPAGVPWLAFCGNDPAVASPDWAHIGYIYYWDGAAWVDTEFWDYAFFTNPHSNATAENGDLNAVAPYPKTAIEIAFYSNSDDEPVLAELPMVAYNVWYDADPTYDEDQPIGEFYVTRKLPGSGYLSPTSFLFGDVFWPEGVEGFAGSGKSGEFFHYNSVYWSEVSTQNLELRGSQWSMYLASAMWSGTGGVGGVGVVRVYEEEGGFGIERIVEVPAPHYSPRRPMDGHYLWVDPTAVSLAVTWEDRAQGSWSADADQVWVGFDSNAFDWHPFIGQVAETGTQDGMAWASKLNMPFVSNADGPHQLVARDGVVYWFGSMYLSDVDGSPVNIQLPLLWRMPISDEEHIPWKRGVAYGPVSMTWSGGG